MSTNKDFIINFDHQKWVNIQGIPDCKGSFDSQYERYLDYEDELVQIKSGAAASKLSKQN